MFLLSHDSPTSPRLSVAFAMFVLDYDPERPTDLRRMTTGIGGWTSVAPPTVELTLAIGLWNAGAPGQVMCRLGVKRPGDDVQYLGEGDTQVNEPAEMVILPLKLTLTCDRPGTYWAVADFDGQRLVEVPFTVTAEDSPAFGGPGSQTTHLQ
jgi:hypothetical protein